MSTSLPVPIPGVDVTFLAVSTSLWGGMVPIPMGLSPSGAIVGGMVPIPMGLSPSGAISGTGSPLKGVLLGVAIATTLPSLGPSLLRMGEMSAMDFIRGDCSTREEAEGWSSPERKRDIQGVEDTPPAAVRL